MTCSDRDWETEKTETILIAAHKTWEEDVYAKLNGKLGKMENLLHILTGLQNANENTRTT